MGTKAEQFTVRDVASTLYSVGAHKGVLRVIELALQAAIEFECQRRMAAKAGVSSHYEQGPTRQRVRANGTLDFSYTPHVLVVTLDNGRVLRGKAAEKALHGEVR